MAGRSGREMFYEAGILLRFLALLVPAALVGA
jgi:hypothetical protein